MLLYFVNSFGFVVQDLRASAADWQYQRARLNQTLPQAGGRHLVLVRYVPGYDVGVEWVYNAADIDESAVVWARDLGEARNKELLEYFHDRRVWLLTVGPGHDWSLAAGDGQEGSGSSATRGGVERGLLTGSSTQNSRD